MLVILLKFCSILIKLMSNITNMKLSYKKKLIYCPILHQKQDFIVKLFILFLIIILCHFKLYSQGLIDYEGSIKPILDKHCVSCHQKGSIAPFALDNWEDVNSRAIMIGAVTTSKYMPPWRADTSFQHYKNENYLDQAEINLIKKWIEGGKEKGKAPRKKSGLAKAQKNLAPIAKTISIGFNQPFVVEGDNREEFRFFHLPSKVSTDQYIQSIEFIPGNKGLVHHSRIMIDTTNEISGIDGLSEEDTAILKFQTKPLADPFLFGWVPGNNKIQFPKGIGKRFYANSDFIVNVHYAPSPIKMKDSSSIKIEFSNDSIEREAQTLTLTENNIANQPFVLPPNKKSTFFMRSPVLRDSISLISIMPHMHLLGQSFKAYAITPNGEIINLVNVPQWDFNWQTTYTFKQLTPLPKGSVIYAQGVYDNTIDNPLNPHHPPKVIQYGWGSKDEMMNLVIYYVSYKNGDEKVLL